MVDYKYFVIREMPRREGRKTKVYSVISKSSETILAVIKWYGPWRQYCFFTTNSPTIWNKECLENIQTFLDAVNNAHKAGRGN